MNYHPFYEIADEAIRYMNAENDWRFIHADSYCMYNLLPSQRMNASLPMWREKQETLFGEIRKQINLPNAVISNFTIVKASKYTICHTIRKHSGIITLSGEAYAAIRSWDTYVEKHDMTEEEAYDRTHEMGDRSMHVHEPSLVRWSEMKAFGFDVAVGEKPLFPGDRCMNFYPKEGAIFIYYRVNPPDAPNLIKKRKMNIEREQL